MQRKWIIVFVIILIVGTALWLWWRQPQKGPQQAAKKLTPGLSVDSLIVNDLDDESTKAYARLSISNNLPISVKTTRFDYQVMIDSVQVVNGSYDQPLTIKASDTTIVELSPTAQTQKIKAVLDRLEQQGADSTTYTIKASFTIATPIAGEQEFSMRVDKRGAAYRPVKTTLAGFEIGKLGLKQSELKLKVDVENRNIFPIQLSDGRYTFTIGDDTQILEGDLKDLVVLPPHSTKQLEILSEVKTLSVPKLGLKFLFDKDDTPYLMNLSYKLSGKTGALENSNVVVKLKGLLGDIGAKKQ